MSLLSGKVGIVVDREFGPRAAQLAREFPLWVIASPGNTPFIQRFWQDQPSRGAQALPGITSFDTDDRESAAAACARIAGTVDEHHGEHAADPPWCEIQVFGVSLSTTLREVFRDIGAVHFEPTPDGFICRRDAIDSP